MADTKAIALRHESGIMEYILHILILICIYFILSASLNLIAGYTGLLSIAHAAFYGVGAYVAALLAVKLHSPFLVNLICAITLSGLLGALIGISSLRFRDDYFVVATFAFQIIVFGVLNNWISLTNGPMGIAGIPPPIVFGWRLSHNLDFLVTVGIVAVLTFWVIRKVALSPFGRILKGIREDETFVQCAGKNITAYKIRVFVIGASFAAVAGVFYAYYITFIDPTNFTVTESIFIISIVIIGGSGSLWGPVIGATVLVSLPELLRFVGLPNAVAGNFRQILYGASLIVCMLWRPQGLKGEYLFQKEIKRL